MISLPCEVTAVLAQLKAAGHSAYVVGGCVRNCLLGLPVADWDICTSALPRQVKVCFAPLPVLDTGLAHGTVTLMMQGQPYEITTLRTEGAYTDSRHPDEVHFTNDLAQDLARRDFTVNAMAFSPESGLVACSGSTEDLAAKTLRCVGDASLRFAEDPLRILRALRFASVLGFVLAQSTQSAAHAQKALLKHVSPERIEAELTKLLCGAHVEEVLVQYSDILAQVLPCIAPCVGFGQCSPHHDKDLWRHTAAAVQAAPAERVLRWSMLLHDMGKPQCASFEQNGTGHFYGHSAVSEKIAETTLRALHSDNALCTAVCRLVKWHDVPLACTQKSALRWLGRIGEESLAQLIEVKRCDARAQAPESAKEHLATLDAFEACVQAALAQKLAFSVSQLAIHGGDVLAQGVAPGPIVGEILRQALDEVMDGKLENNPAALKAWLCDIITKE